MRQGRRLLRASKDGCRATMAWLGALALALVLAGCSVGGAATPPSSPSPSPSPGATPTQRLAVATATAAAVPTSIVALPEGMTPRDQVRVDLDGNGAEEVVILSALGQAEGQLSARALSLVVLKPTATGYSLAWTSGELAGERGERLRVGDFNGDGRPEVASIQSMGAGGETLYLLGWLGAQEGYGLLKPRGGYFDGGDSFGEVGARLEDVDGDGTMEVLGDYGGAASRTEVYRWNGKFYEYAKVPVAQAAPTAGPREGVSEGMNLTLRADRGEYARGQSVQLTLTVVNEGKSPLSLEFNDGQRFDMAVFDPAGNEVWRWSRGMMFTMALGTLRLNPGAEHVYQASWQVEGKAGTSLPAGRYTARGWLTSSDAPERPEVTFSVR